MGNTVEVLKSVVESDYGIPMAKQVSRVPSLNLSHPA
jgi:hypothetical protein